MQFGAPKQRNEMFGHENMLLQRLWLMKLFLLSGQILPNVYFSRHIRCFDMLNVACSIYMYTLFTVRRTQTRKIQNRSDNFFLLVPAIDVHQSNDCTGSFEIEWETPKKQARHKTERKKKKSRTQFVYVLRIFALRGFYWSERFVYWMHQNLTISNWTFSHWPMDRFETTTTKNKWNLFKIDEDFFFWLLLGNRWHSAP